MSTPDHNSTVSVAVSRSISVSAASETLVTPAYTAKTQPSQAPPTPLAQPPYRALAPLLPHPHPHQPNPFQQAHNIYAHPYTVRRPNSVTGSPQQDPSSHLHQFAPSTRGFSNRPSRPSSPSVVDPGSPGGYPPRPVIAYHNRQFGANLDPMIQFMRAAHPQFHQTPQVGSGPMRGIPHFSQPRVAPPLTTSILDNNGHKNSRSRDDALVVVRGRKVRITEGASLYSLCRSWLRNGAHEGIQPQQNDTMVSLPKPLPVDTMEKTLPKDSVEEPNSEDKEDEESVKELSATDLLKRHVSRAKEVRARLREERLKRIARYKARLALLLPPYGE